MDEAQAIMTPLLSDIWSRAWPYLHLGLGYVPSMRSVGTVTSDPV